MSTQTTFDNMLNEYLPNSLLSEELMKRDWLLQNVEKDNTWLGGTLIVPFEGAGASTVKMGSLAAVEDVNQAITVRGQITNQPELWGTMKFNEKDLVRHGKISEQNLLRILPDQIESFIKYIRMVTSLSITNGAVFAKAAGNGTVGAGIKVNRPERFVVGQPVILQDDDTGPNKYWVKSVNLEDTVDLVVLATDITLATIADLSGFTTANNARFYFDGGETPANRFTSLKDSLLSATNGGSASLYGQVKTAYPYTQAINVSGAGFTTVTFLDDLFKAMVKVRNKCSGNPDTFVMSWYLYSLVLIALQVEKGPYRMASEMNTSEYNFGEVTIVGPKGRARIVAVQEIDNDYVMLLDMSAIKFYSNGFFRKRVDPGDGKQYYTIRNTNGYVYVCDIALYGDLVLEHPNRCGIIHDIPAALSAL